MIYTLATELSDRKIYFIGSIVSQWGFLESDIFDQTLLSFSDGESLPPSMNNAQFSLILELWRERIVEKQHAEKKGILKAQYDEILSLNEYRQAVVHSRWEWTPHIPEQVTAVRVHKRNVKRVSFTADDLENFSNRLGQVRFWVRYPGGSSDRAAEITSAGGYVSRRWFDLIAGRAGLPK